MRQDCDGSTRGRLGLGVALMALPLLVSSARSFAGIANVEKEERQQTALFGTNLISHAEDGATAEMYLPDPFQNAVVADPAIPEITIPQLPSETVATAAPTKDGVNAIPLPPAVQSGLTG